MTKSTNKNKISLQDLFISKRLNSTAMSKFNWLVFILYFPFGCILAISRFSLAFILSLILPNRFRYLALKIIGGLICKSSSKMPIPEKGALLISNHSNYFDPIVINSCLKNTPHLPVVIWQGVNFFSRVICSPTLSVFNPGKNSNFKQELNQLLDKQSVIIFPEGSVSDNTQGLLAFQSSVFRMNRPIYMVAIKYERCFDFLSGKALSKHMGLEALVDLFQPWIKVHLQPLGKFEGSEKNNAFENAQQAQKIIANALELEATAWNKNDRHRLLFSESKTRD